MSTYMLVTSFLLYSHERMPVTYRPFPTSLEQRPNIGVQIDLGFASDASISITTQLSLSRSFLKGIMGQLFPRRDIGNANLNTMSNCQFSLVELEFALKVNLAGANSLSQ